MELGASMSFAEDSPAKTSPPLAGRRGSTGSGPGYGARSPVLLARFDRTTSSWKIRQACLPGMESQNIVHCGHGGVPADPQAIDDIRRILLLHLKETSQDPATK